MPGKSHGQRSLVGCSPWGREESDTTERLHFLFSLSCIGEGNGNPLQSSCLENPRDGGAWWAAVYGVAQSRTRLKRLLSSSSRIICRMQESTILNNYSFLLRVWISQMERGMGQGWKIRQNLVLSSRGIQVRHSRHIRLFTHQPGTSHELLCNGKLYVST